MNEENNNAGSGEVNPPTNGGTPPANTGTSWLDGIENQETRDLMAAKGYDSPADLAQAYSNLNKAYKGSNDVVSLPKDGDSDAFLSLMDKLGRPSESSGYQLGLGEDAKVNSDYVTAMTAVAHETGLTQTQFKAMVDANQKFAMVDADKTAKLTTEQQEAELAAVKKKWGDDWDKNISAGQRFIKAAGITEELFGRVEAKLGTSDALELFAQVGSKIGAEGETILEGGENDFGMSPEQARVKIREIQSGQDKEFASILFDPKHSQHKAKQAERNRLYEIAYGSKQ